ncbi:hypothetical protein CJU90_5483 [Yarrowia sp. C11]|nr:hypothetical protein CJU90_5483 [Yarrowia sp. C11]KAG5364073.1 hypothetical protein CKK34_2862 [Yarrowia sp. E02]
MPAHHSPYQQRTLEDHHHHIQEFEWLRIVESVLADREYTDTEITQEELEELIPTLEGLDISSDEDDDFSFSDYIHFSPHRIVYPVGTPKSQTRTQTRQITPRSIPRTKWNRKPGSFSPLAANSPLETKKDANGGSPRKKRPTRIPVLSSRLGPPIYPINSGLSAFRSNLRNSPIPKLQVFEDDSEENEEQESPLRNSVRSDSPVKPISNTTHNNSSIELTRIVERQTPSLSPPSTPPGSQVSLLGFAANVTEPLRRSRRIDEAELYTEPRSPGRICSPIKRELNLKPSLKVSGNSGSPNKLISSLQSALTGSELLGFYSASDHRARLEGKETRERKRRPRRQQRTVKWAEELEW